MAKRRQPKPVICELRMTPGYLLCEALAGAAVVLLIMWQGGLL